MTSSSTASAGASINAPERHDVDLRVAGAAAAAERRFAADNTRALAMLTEKGHLPDVARAIVMAFERRHRGLRAAVCALDTDDRRRTIAAPSLPVVWTATADATGADSCDVLDPGLVVEDDLRRHPAWTLLQPLADAHGLGASWSAPISGPQGRVIGRFTVYADAARPPVDDEVAAISMSAALAAAAIDRCGVGDATRLNGEHDELTGLCSRRRLYEDLRTASDEGHARRRLVALYHLDGIGEYADACGHVAADALLRRLAGRLAAAAAGAGVSYRLSDNVFCLLLAGSGAGSQAACERGLAALAETGLQVDVSARCGTAMIDGSAANADDLLRSAEPGIAGAVRQASLHAA